MTRDRILVIRLTALGDVVLVEPVLRALRSRFPNTAIDLLTEARFAALGATFFGADSVVGYDRHGADRGWPGMARVIRRLPAREYLAIVDLQNKIRTRLLAWRIPARHKVAMQKRTLAGGLGAMLGYDRPLVERHATDLYLDALEPLGIDSSLPRVDPRPRTQRPPPLALRQRDEKGPLIGLAPGATHATKRWPVAHFAALVVRLARALPDASFVLLGGAQDHELLGALEGATRPAGVRFVETDVAGMDVAGLAQATASLDLLISVDTGPAHLGAAVGVPVVAIFGPTSPERWGPRGDEHRVVSLRLACSPCSNIGGAICPLPSHSHECMQALDPDRVLEAALSALGRSIAVERGAPLAPARSE